jgi:hypothetical protein
MTDDGECVRRYRIQFPASSPHLSAASDPQCVCQPSPTLWGLWLWV